MRAEIPVHSQGGQEMKAKVESYARGESAGHGGKEPQAELRVILERDKSKKRQKQWMRLVNRRERGARAHHSTLSMIERWLRAGHSKPIVEHKLASKRTCVGSRTGATRARSDVLKTKTVSIWHDPSPLELGSEFEVCTCGHKRFLHDDGEGVCIGCGCGNCPDDCEKDCRKFEAPLVK
jgi:hypothetical protein